jgi:hypothetical protein
VYGNPQYRTTKTILEKALDPQPADSAARSIASIGAFLRRPAALFTTTVAEREEVSA